MGTPRVWLVCALMSAAVGVERARADAFTAYGLAETFSLPASSVFDVLDDGRLVTLVGEEVFAETAVGSRNFGLSLGTLPDADIPSFGAAFLRVSPDGSRIAVGNGGGASFDNAQVGVFDLSGLAGHWFSVRHFDAAWIDDTDLALTAGSFGQSSEVTALDTTSDPLNPENPTIIENIGGASAGVTFDDLGNLYTGNGFAGSGPSVTGWIKAFKPAEWTPGLTGGSPADFESLVEGTHIATLLSAAALGFDAEGNLHVGGAINNAALVHHTAVTNALGEGGPADPADLFDVRLFDPDVASLNNFYDVNYNGVTGELYFREGDTVYSYLVPEPASFMLLTVAVIWGTRRRPRRIRLRFTGVAPRTAESRASFRHHDTTNGVVMRRASAVFAVALLSVTASTMVARGESPFATAVVDYSPAPGQFVNDSAFNDPSRALGSPIGGGTNASNNSKLVSLGGFGGSITLRFDHTVLDDMTNPFGLDAIVFGNASWVIGDPNRHWAECGYLEISRDTDEDGLANDPWYLIPGSHIANATGQWETQTWDDDIMDTTYPPANLNWIPPGQTGVWNTAAYRLPPGVFDSQILNNPNGLGATDEGVFGYADFAPVLILGDLDGDNVVDDLSLMPREFYTAPDDPFEVGMTPGCGGGDAFDIAWAIDPMTGQPAELDGFDFIRITNGVNFVRSSFGEVSTEIGGVADVLPGDGDLNCDGVLDGLDIGPFVLALTDPAAYEVAHPDCKLQNADIDDDGEVGALDVGMFVAALSGE